MSLPDRSGNRLPRAKRVDKAYRLTLATGGFALATVVGFVLALVTSFSWALVFLFAAITAVLAMMTKRSVSK